MALDNQTGVAQYDAPEKDLYEIGEMPPMGYVPKQMYAWAIRRERHGDPEQAFRSRWSTPGRSTATRCWFW